MIIELNYKLQFRDKDGKWHEKTSLAKCENPGCDKIWEVRRRDAKSRLYKFCNKCHMKDIAVKRTHNSWFFDEFGKLIAKYCARCDATKPIEDFYIKSKTGEPHSYCDGCQCENSKEWAEIHKEHVQTYQKQWKSKSENKEICNEWARKRRENDISFKISGNLRTRVSDAIRNKGRKSARTFELIGCNINQLLSYLEERFLPGMNWKNYGIGEDKWNIDHILPCRGFDLSKPEEQRKCFHYSNLQPLWHLDNVSKNDILPNGTNARDLVFEKCSPPS